MSKSLKIIFAGTPDFAARHLAALLDSEHQIVAAYTQPDRPAGRGKKLQASAVKQLAIENSIPVFQPATLKTAEAQQQLAALDADLMVVVAYGLILPKAVLAIPPSGCLNVHGSLLPKWRGAAPIQRAIWAGDDETGITIMQMDEGLDTGAMLLKSSLPISHRDTSASLYEKLADLGPQALLSCLSQLFQLQPQQQNNEQATYASKLSKQEAQIDWHLPAAQLERNIRAFNPWPVAYLMVEQQPVKVWQASVVKQSGEPGRVLQADKNGIVVACGEHALCIESLQIPGKKAMPVADLLNARAAWFAVGTLLT